MELRFYIVNTDEDFDFIGATKEEFIAKSEELGTVYSLDGFVADFNNPNGKINMELDQLRVYNVAEEVSRELQIEQELYEKYNTSFDITITCGIDNDSISITPHDYRVLANELGTGDVNKAFELIDELEEKYLKTI